MTEKSSQLCRGLLADIDKVFPPVSLASVKLTESQRAEVNRLRNEIRRLCEAGKDEEARRVADMALAIIHTGPPEPE